jgi:hypothetical protein
MIAAAVTAIATAAIARRAVAFCSAIRTGEAGYSSSAVAPSADTMNAPRRTASIADSVQRKRTRAILAQPSWRTE